MVRVKDPRKMTEIAALYGQGLNIQDIAQHVGMTRGTVRGYLRSPEMEGAVEAVQDDMVEVLSKSVKTVSDVIDKKIPQSMWDNDPKTAAKIMLEQTRLAGMIIDKLGSKIIAQVTTADVSKDRTRSSEETARMKEQLRTLILSEVPKKGEQNAEQVTGVATGVEEDPSRECKEESEGNKTEDYGEKKEGSSL